MDEALFVDPFTDAPEENSAIASPQEQQQNQQRASNVYMSIGQAIDGQHYVNIKQFVLLDDRASGLANGAYCANSDGITLRISELSDFLLHLKGMESALLLQQNASSMASAISFAAQQPAKCGSNKRKRQ